MSQAAVVLVLAAGGQGDVLSLSLAEALGSSVAVERVDLLSTASEEDAARRGLALVERRWLDPLHGRALLRARPSGSDRWLHTHLSFRPEDALPERERALGFALAALLGPSPAVEDPPAAALDEEEESPGAAQGRPSPDPATAATTAPPGSPPRPDPPATGAAPAAEAPPGPSTRTEAAPAERALALHLHAALLASAAPWGDGATWGVTAAGELSLGDALALRAGGTARFGALPDARASTHQLTAGLGLRLTLFGADPVGLAVRGELQATYLAVERAPDGGRPAMSRSRWVPGGALVLEATWPLITGVELVLGLGAEGRAGVTRVTVGDTPAATLSRLQLLGELGARASF